MGRVRVFGCRGRNRFIGKAHADLVFHNDRFTIFLDREIEIAVILCKAVGGFRFKQQIAAVLQTANLIYAGISLGKIAVQFVNVRIIGLVAVYIQIEYKFCAAEQLVVILAADLPDLYLCLLYTS